MKQIIYNFLDDSIGDGVKLIPNKEETFYRIYSNNQTLILSFAMRNDWEFVKLYRYEPLCRKVSSLFSISEDESAKLISNWFGERNDLKKVGDLKKFVSKENQILQTVE